MNLAEAKRTFGNISYRSIRVWQRNNDVFMKTWAINFLPPLLEPILYVVAFSVGLGGLIGKVTYRDQILTYTQFMAPGVVAVAVMFWSFFETTYSTFIRMRYQKTFDAVLATPLLAEDIVAGEWLWGATKSVMAVVIMLGALTPFGLVAWPSGLWVLVAAILGGLLFSAVGLMMSAIVPRVDTFNLPIFILVFPMFLFSATFFPIDVLPHWALRVAHVLPLTHISIIIRDACLGLPMADCVWSFAYLLIATPLISGIAILMMKKRLVS